MQYRLHCQKKHLLHHTLLKTIFVSLFSFCIYSLCPTTLAKEITGNEINTNISSNSVTLAFDQLFGKQWQNKALTTWQLAVPIDTKKLTQNPLHIQWGNNRIHLKISRYAVTYFNEYGQKSFNDLIRPNAQRLYLVFESNGHDRAQIQLVQTKENSVLAVTPFINWPIPHTTTFPKIRIDGLTDDDIHTEKLVKVVGNKDVLAPVRKKRNTYGQIICAHDTFWILDFLLHTHCEIQYSGKDLLALLDQQTSGYAQVGGQTPEQQIERPYYHEPRKSASTLKNILVGTKEKPILSSYAAAKACFVPLHTVLSNRKPRGNPQIDYDCVYSTEHIISIYTRIYGTTSSGQWNQRHFDRLINHILRTGKTGDSHLSADDENALVSAVQIQQAIEQAIKENYIAQVSDDFIDYHPGWLAEIGFSYAQDAYASYTQSTENNAAYTQNTTILTPQEVQQIGALGRYSIDVDDFNEAEIPSRPPRVFSNGQWHEDANTSFDTSLINVQHISANLRNDIEQTIRLWIHEYNGMDPEYDLYIRSDDLHLRALAQTGRTAAMAGTHVLMALASIDRPGTIYPPDRTYLAVTRYNNRIVSIFVITASEESEEDQTDWEIDFALTESRSLIPVSTEAPNHYIDGALRGSGQATLRALLLEAQEMHIGTIHATVVSIPSALMFHKNGFKLIIPLRDTEQ